MGGVRGPRSWRYRHSLPRLHACVHYVEVLIGEGEIQDQVRAEPRDKARRAPPCCRRRPVPSRSPFRILLRIASLIASHFPAGPARDHDRLEDVRELRGIARGTVATPPAPIMSILPLRSLLLID